MKLSVIMMVKNGASTIERAIRPLAGVADEILMHDTGSDDETVGVAAELCEKLGIKFWPVWSTFRSRSSQYFADNQASFRREVAAWQGKWTDKPILRDWSWGLNEALDMAQAPYVMRLDADDVFLIPENILPTLGMLDQKPEIEIVSCPYEIVQPTSYGEYEPAVTHMLERIWRRGSVRFERVMHERLTPKRPGALIYAGSGLRCRDMRDSRGDGIRVYGRNAKVLLREFERSEEQDSDFLFTLAHEMIPFDAAWSLELLQMVNWESGNLPVLQAEVLFQIGRANEELGNLEGAIAHYSRAIEISRDVRPHANPLLRRGFLLKQLCPDDVPRWTSDFEEASKQAKLLGMFDTDLKLLAKANLARSSLVGSEL